MSEKVKSNIFVKVVPENLYLIQKRLIYLKQLLRYEKISLRRPFSKMAANASRAKSENLSVCQMSCLYHKTHNSAIFCYISAGLYGNIDDFAD